MQLQQQHQSSQPITIGSQTTTPTFQSIITHIGSPTVSPTDFICFVSCILIMAPNTFIATIIALGKFYAGPPMTTPEINIIHVIDLLLVTVLPFTPTPTVVLIPPPEFYASPRRVYDICQRYIITDILNYYSTYFVPFMEKHVY